MRPTPPGAATAWTKAKCRAGHEVVIGGWSTTTAGNSARCWWVSIAAIDLIYVGRVGTGYSAAKVKHLMPRLKDMATKTSPFTGKSAPKQERGVNWLKPQLVAEIEFAGWTGDGMVRQAAFKGLAYRQVCQGSEGRDAEEEQKAAFESRKDRA